MYRIYQGKLPQATVQYQCGAPLLFKRFTYGLATELFIGEDLIWGNVYVGTQTQIITLIKYHF